jgi:outer membrane protein assembly factor BamB
MKHAGAAIAVLFPLVGCVEPAPNKLAELATDAPHSDQRPDVGSVVVGLDLTALAREQNAKGMEPPLPTQVGSLSHAAARPRIVRTSNGFVASLPNTSVVNTPAYHQGRIYAGGDGTYELHAMDAESGRPAWSVRLSDDGPTAPACKEGVCVFNTYSCTMFGVDAASGRHLWSWWLGSPQLATPIIAGDKVYTSYPGSGPQGASFVLAAFGLRDGKPLWRRWIDAEVNSTPVAYGASVYVATQVGTLYEFGAEDGAVVSVRQNRAASPPVVTASGIVFGRDDLGLPDDLVATSEVIFPQLEGDARWRSPVRPKPRPLVARHRLITIDDDVLIATDRHSGRRLWQHKLDDAAAMVSAPLLYAGNSVLVATSEGDVLRVEPETGGVTERFRLGAGTLSSPPIVHDGWIYAGTTSGTMVAHDTGARELTGWPMLGGGPERQGSVDPEDS